MLWLTLLYIALTFQPTASSPLEFNFDVKPSEAYANKVRRGLELDARGVHKRGTVSALAYNYLKSEYLVDLGIGSNNQRVSLQLDTGSSELWVPANDVKCLASDAKTDGTKAGAKKNGAKMALPVAQDPSAATATTCTSLGSFNTGTSTSWKKKDGVPAFHIKYKDDTEATGVWGTDDVQLGAVRVKNVMFGVVKETSARNGFLGLGLASNEASYWGNTPSFGYENFPQKLKSQGLIRKTAYSLYLDEDAKLGTVLFGGVDRRRFTGPLVTLPIVTGLDYIDQTAIAELMVLSDGLTILNGARTIVLTTNRYVTILDSGTTHSVIPEFLHDKIVQTLHGKYNAAQKYYEVNCALASGLSLQINYGGNNYPVPLSEFIIPGPTASTCILGTTPTSGTSIIFGDDVLRHLYVVYNLDDLEISIAKTRADKKKDIVEIVSTVPGATRAPDYTHTDLILDREPSMTEFVTPVATPHKMRKRYAPDPTITGF